jgi:maleate isomerase
MPSDYFKVGLILPSSNTVMEPDFHRQLGSGCVISTARIFLEQVTREAEIAMIEEVPAAGRLLKTTQPHAVVFGCTSAGSLGGIKNDLAIARRIEEQTGARAVTVVGSVLEQLKAINPASVAVLTPYVDELSTSVAQCVVEGGYKLVKTAGMGIVANTDIGRVTPEEIVDFVADQIDGVDVDCIFLSCTNWQAVEAIDAVKTHFGLPVISSNQATIEAVRAMWSDFQGV